MSLVAEADAEPIPGYRLLERLGGGGFGEVWKAAAPGGLLKAIKIVHGDVRQLDSDGSHRAEQELRALQRVQSIRHPYLLSIERYDVIDGRLMIVTELADCNLFDRYDKHHSEGKPGIPRDELLRYLREAAEVLDLMNLEYQLQHLDIKPQNLFLIHDHVKVADFGLVKDLEGLRTEMTGGVTPLYAAPETFEGVITPYCDQYSLAIVYQELLTGYRPFAGSNVQQLIMQHLQAPPNLSSLPHADRPAVAKALAKKPENRHPSCMALIDALQAGSVESPQRRAGSRGSDENQTQARTTVQMEADQAELERGINIGASMRRFEQRGAKPYRPETPPTVMRIRREDTPGPAVAEPVGRTAPPEFTGNGVLYPALVIGLGRAGLSALKRLRQSVCERFAAMSVLPQLRLLYIDTDPDSADAAASGAGGAALEADEILLLRLNRASHYLKPRHTGRSLIDGWFDPQWLYRIPRSLQVQGQRALGRLVFGDHYAAIASRIEEEIERITLPDALLRADKHTSLGVRTNRPRAYVIAHLGGGTGGGMFIDVAYAVRNRLKFLGYGSPDVTGLLTLPKVVAATPAQSWATANAHAALKELTHYSHPDGAYVCTFDDRDAALTDSAPPFDRTLVLPGDFDAVSGSPRDGNWQAADFLVRDLTHQFGRLVDNGRAAVLKTVRPLAEATAGTFGLVCLTWPRKAMVRCASRRLCEFVIQRWARRDVESVRPAVHARISELWQAQHLGPEALTQRLNDVVTGLLTEPAGSYFSRLALPFAPKGWFGGTFDVEAGYGLLTRLDELMGRPDGGATAAGGLLSDALLSSADGLVKEWGTQLAQVVVTLIEQPEFRMTGAEEAVHQLRSLIDNLRQKCCVDADNADGRAAQQYSRLHHLLASPPGRRAASEFVELTKSYPLIRIAGLVQRRIADIGLTLSRDLNEQLSEIGFCRQRLDELLANFQADSETPPDTPYLLLPSGCANAGEAVRKLVAAVTDDDLQELDRRMQKMVQTQFTALVHVCLSTSQVLNNLEPAMLKLAQQFMDTRVAESNAAQMFRERHSDAESYYAALQQAFDDAEPPLVDTIGVMTSEVVVLSVPPGEAGDAIAAAGRSIVNPLLSPPSRDADGDLPVTIGHDDVAFYRELPRVPLARLPQLGPKARECYQQVADHERYPPHTRTDVEQWLAAP